MTDIVRLRLNRWRQKLIDQTLRNPLLNFRPNRATSIRVVEADPAEVFRVLQLEGKPMTFRAAVLGGTESTEKAFCATMPFAPDDLATPQAAELASANAPQTTAPLATVPQATAPPAPVPQATALSATVPQAALEAVPEHGATVFLETLSEVASTAAPVLTSEAVSPSGEQTSAVEAQIDFSAPQKSLRSTRSRSTELQTDLAKEALDLIQLRIFQKATSIYDEQGFSSLCLSIGMLAWSDKDNQDKENSEARLRAPLILVPVQLVRETARSKFTLVATQDDPVLNPAIAEKLRASFRIMLPPMPDSYEDFEPLRYFDEIKEAIAEQKSWHILEEINLGFFAFHKFVMYKDLEMSEDTYAAHDIIGALCTSKAEFLERDGDDSDAPNLDEVMLPESTFQVLDADSSQQQAIMAAKDGKNLVIEGPPGTGKSQTITNLIAETLAAGKTVLFVSEKMAALEVVYNRLNSAGLNDFCLQLHSNKTSKKAVYEEIQRVLDSARPVDHKEDSELDRLMALRGHLNDYAHSLHAPYGLLNISPYKAIGALCQMEHLPIVNAAMPGLVEVDKLAFDRHCRNLAHFSQMAAEIGGTAEHPWANCQLLDLTATDEDLLHEALHELNALVEKLREKCDSLAQTIGATEAATIEQGQALCEVAKTLVRSPGGSENLIMTDKILADRIMNDKWNTHAKLIAELLECGDRYAKLKCEVEQWFKPGIIEEDFEESLGKYRAHATCFYRHAVPEFWQQRRYFARFFKAGYKPKSTDELFEHLEMAVKCREAMLAIKSDDGLGQELFADKWQGANSNWKVLRDLADWIVTVRRYIAEQILTPKGILLAATGRAATEAIMAATDELSRLIEQVQLQIAQLGQLGHFNWAHSTQPGQEQGLLQVIDHQIAIGRLAPSSASPGRETHEGLSPGIGARESLSPGSAGNESAVPGRAGNESASLGSAGILLASPSTSLDTLAQWVATLCKNIPRVHEWIALNQAKAACSDGLTGPFFARFLEQNHDTMLLEATFRRSFFRRWLDSCYSERPVLARFQPMRHEQLIEEFRRLDAKGLELAKQRLRHNLCRARDRQLNSGELQEELLILQKQIRARSKLPLRKLFRHVPKVIKSIKPCMMMSPLSAAQFIDSASEPFDMVIFDEASQITCEDAVGSILRGRQLVVVGDTKQLPPTNFFAAQLTDDGSTSSAVDERDELQIVDLSSVLDNCMASRFAVRRLKWHYRSRHESLIAFSNREFYKGDLFTFPGPETGVEDRGLTFEHVQGVYHGSGVNPIEAQAVADAVCDHIRQCPELSLGVGTFNVKQQTLIRDELDKRRRDDPSLEFFFAKKGEGEFFVKNLENIQGDDRDVIFLSITYGPGADGQVRHNFGPINGENGWRRLNVILTRAKLRLKVFSSMRAQDIDPSRATSLGASYLRAFLGFAERGSFGAPSLLDGVIIEPTFEQTVYNELTKHGLQLVPQIGQAGYRIDFGVMDDAIPGRFLAGIECDGATYRSAATARDRDRLRQEVLVALGWNLIRIWSTDWYHNKEAQIKRVLDFVEQERSLGKHDPVVPAAASTDRVAEEPPMVDVPPADLLSPFAENNGESTTNLVASRGALPERLLDNLSGSASSGGAGILPASVPNPSHASEDISEPVAIESPLTTRRPVIPYSLTPVQVLGDIENFSAAPDQSILNVMEQVLDHEAPIHVEELKRRVAAHWEIPRLAGRVATRMDALVQSIIDKSDAVRRDDFIWKTGNDHVAPRSRKIKGQNFQAESVPPEELDEFILHVLDDGKGRSKEEIVTAAVKAMGFGRAGQTLADRIQPRIQFLLEQSILEPCSNGVRLAIYSTQQTFTPAAI